MSLYPLKNGQKVTIHPLTTDHLDAILELQTVVLSSLEQTAFLQPLERHEYEWILSGKGAMLGVFSGQQLIAFRAMFEPNLDEEEHLGKDIGLQEDELSAVLYSEISNVHPAYRGNRLQQLLGQLLFKQVDRTRFRYICTTVAPFNIASLKDKFALNMEVLQLKEKYNGKLRYILLKDLHAKRPSLENAHRFRIQMDHHEKQIAYLADGWRGYNIEQDAGQWYLQLYRLDD